jgi:hypothetical protein
LRTGNDLRDQDDLASASKVGNHRELVQRLHWRLGLARRSRIARVIFHQIGIISTHRKIGHLRYIKLLAQAHESGHEGVQKTAHRWRTSIYNSKALQRVREFVHSCAVCQQHKTQHLHPAGLLQPLPIPSMVWVDISMDFIEGFPKVGGKSVVLTVVDWFSKYGHLITLGHPYSAASVAKASFDEIVKLHGLPCSIVSDRDTVFTRRF